MAVPKRTILTSSYPTQPDSSPVASKKRKLGDSIPSSQLNASHPHSSQGFTQSQSHKSSQTNGTQKSVFETEVLEKLTQDISGLKGKNQEKDQQWERPSLENFSPQRDAVCFQAIDCEVAEWKGQATMKLFGVTESGHSVCLHVTDFLHYLYIAAPVGFTVNDCDGFRMYLDNMMSMSTGGAIHSVTMVKRENLFGFQGNVKSPYLKITLLDPKLHSRLKVRLEESCPSYKGLWKQLGAEGGGVRTFDIITYDLRFMIDKKIAGMSWVEVEGGMYNMVPPREKHTTCQIEATVTHRYLTAHPIDGEWAKMAPLRILSFDIECAGRKGIFPEATKDPVIQIANVVTRYGEPKPFVRNVFVLDTCRPIINTQILEFDSEEEMLMSWQKFLQKVDPDVIIGYNIANFDFPYLLDRAKYLRQKDFPYWTRLVGKKTDAVASHFSSKQMGNRDTKATNTNGRIQLDLLQLVQRDHQLRSYTLNSVCAEFLGEQKEDVHHTMITELFNGTPESRRRLAVYCLKDAYLPQRLMDKLMCLVNYTEMARVTGVPFTFLLARGQQVKFISQMFRKAQDKGLVIPNLNDKLGDDPYEGATVIEPVRGYYKEPVATLDFASLYPSIIQAHNLCYTTLLRSKADVERWKLVKDRDYIVTPNGDLFCTATVRKGLLTEILEELLGARKRAKKELAIETDAFKKAVLNGRQLALKISANSVYGVTGATNGKLPCLAIASSTTSFGRMMIERTKEEVEKRYSMANGYKHDAQVIYGDTDSVMIKFGPDDIHTVMDLGREAAAYVSSKFVSPIKLEFEKVYYPYLLINKKRYAGLYWSNPDKWDKMDSKGIETVRRDNCRLVQNVIETILRMILMERDVDGAQAYVRRVIADLLQNKIDLSLLVITKALTKKEDDYTAKQAHTELAERMRKRDEGSAPGLGDRVAYVIVKGSADKKNYEKSEDPIYVLEHNVPIDTKYYLENQLAKPLERIFGPMLSVAKFQSLLNGDHTRAVQIARGSKTALGGMGSLMKFTKKSATCMACKKPLPGDADRAGAVCEDDKERLGELYGRQIGRLRELEGKFGRLWTQCQRCQGSLHNEVICSSRDCPIFYMRMKVRRDVEEVRGEVGRFDREAGLW